MLLRLQQITRGEAPSWSFGEESPNDTEGTSVAFTTVAAVNLCASDSLHVPSVQVRAPSRQHTPGRRTKLV